MVLNRSIAVACVQFPSLKELGPQSSEILNRFFTKLKNPADLIVLPEMWPSNFYWTTLSSLEKNRMIDEHAKILETLMQKAREQGCYVISPQLEASSEGLHNTAFLIGPKGNIEGKYRKIHLFEPGGETEHFKPGNTIEVFETAFGRIGIAICYDLRFPELTRKMVLSGAEILIIPAAWPKIRIDHYHALLKARAIENLCFVIGVNKIGESTQGEWLGGGSLVLNPWGEVIGQLGEDAENLEVLLDLADLKEIRARFRALEARREEIY